MPEALAASCGSHAQAPAVATCRRCGLFLCDACVTLDGDESYCPTCAALRNAPARARSRHAFFGAVSVVPLLATVGLMGMHGPPLWLLGFPAWAIATGLAVSERRRLKGGSEERASRRWLRAALVLLAIDLLPLLAFLYLLARFATHTH